MNTDFNVKKFKDATVYTLESASAGGTSSGSIASVSSPMGGVRKRGDNLIAQEGDKDKVDASKPRNFVAKNAKMGGAGQHKDKKKAEKQGDVKHRKPFSEQGVAEGSESLEAWETRMKKLGYKITKDNKTGTYHAWQGTTHKGSHRTQGVAEGEVVPLGKKHRGDLSDTHSCPKCGGDLQGGKYMGHAVKVCQPCKQVYLPPNSGIDQQGNKTNEQGVAEGSNQSVSLRDMVNVVDEHYPKYYAELSGSDISDRQFERAIINAYKKIMQKQGVAEGLSEMDNRTPSGDREEQRRNRPEAKAKQDKEQQNRLKDTSPEMRKKLRLPEPKEGVAEAEKNPHPKTWHDVDKKLGKAVDKMSQAEKVKKGWAMDPSQRVDPRTGKKMVQKGVAEGSEQVYNIVAVDKSNAMSKPKKLTYKAGSIEEVFDALAANDWYPLEINGVEVINGKHLKQGVAEGDSGAKYKVKSIGYDSKGDYYISPSTGKKVYKKADKGDHENPKTGEIKKKVAEDHEIQMASSELQSIAKNAVHLLDLVRKYSEQEGLDAWQQSKITKAADYLNAVLQSISGEQTPLEGVGVPSYGVGGARNRGDDERHDLDDPELQRNRQEVTSYNITINGKPINPKPIFGRSATIAWGKQQAAAGVDLSNAMISPVRESTSEDHSTATGGWGQRAYAGATGSSKWAGAGHDDAQRESNHPDEKEDKALIRKMVRAQALKQEDSYMAELQAKLAEKIPKNAPVDVWIKDFEKSNAPQFRGKNPAKRRQMAVAASYGAKNPGKKK